MQVTYDVTLTVEVAPDEDGWVSRPTLDQLELAIYAAVEYSSAREALDTALDAAMPERVEVIDFGVWGRSNPWDVNEDGDWPLSTLFGDRRVTGADDTHPANEEALGPLV